MCKLTNKDISKNYRDKEFHFMRSDFLGAFAFWVVYQSPYDAPDIMKALVAFKDYISTKVSKDMPKKLTYGELQEIINEDAFESIPEIEKLNHPKIPSGVEYESRHNQHPMNPDFDFVSLGALARNIFYMLLRERITQGA